MIKRSLFLLILVLFLLVFFMQPVQGASLTESSFINGPDCNFTNSVPQTRPPSEDETTAQKGAITDEYIQSARDIILDSVSKLGIDSVEIVLRVVPIESEEYRF